jgi:hypothetical protein
MPASRYVVSTLLRELGDLLDTLKAGPAGGRLRRPFSRRQQSWRGSLRRLPSALTVRLYRTARRRVEQ